MRNVLAFLAALIATVVIPWGILYAVIKAIRGEWVFMKYIAMGAIATVFIIVWVGIFLGAYKDFKKWFK